VTTLQFLLLEVIAMRSRATIVGERSCTEERRSTKGSHLISSVMIAAAISIVVPAGP